MAHHFRRYASGARLAAGAADLAHVIMHARRAHLGTDVAADDARAPCPLLARLVSTLHLLERHRVVDQPQAEAEHLEQDPEGFHPHSFGLRRTKQFFAIVVRPACERRNEIAEVSANKTLSADEKKEMLKELNEALNSVQPIQFPGNIELIRKYYDKIQASLN